MPLAHRLRRLSLPLLAAALAGLTLSAHAATSGESSNNCDAPSWVAAWALPTRDTAAGFDRQTVRVVSTPSIGGQRVRVRLSNVLGDTPVTLTDVHAGRVESDAELVPSSNVPLRFGGENRVTIPAGQTVTSDPAPLHTKAFAPVAVSFYAPAPTGPATGHDELATTYVADGNHAAHPGGENFGSGSPGGRLVAAVDVFTPNDGAIVALGDSITEGFSTDRNVWGESGPYTDTLARRLHQAAADGGPRLSVINAGIGGNRVLSDRTGPAAVKRLDEDVLAQSGLSGVIMMEGINDLHALFGDPTPPTVTEMAAGYTDIIDAVRAAGADIWLSPLTPAGDAKRPTPFTHSITAEHVARRHAINRWIRSQSSAYDGRVDFETVVLDPQWPNWIAAQYDSGDNLHPNNAGLAAMGTSVNLSLFDRYRCA